VETNLAKGSASDPFVQINNENALLVTYRPVCRPTAPYSPELEPDIVLIQPHASGVDEILHTPW
jgi:hypothetical protein